MKIGDFKGEAKEGKHKDWIEIDSWSLGAVRSVSAGGKGMVAQGDTMVHDVTISKGFDLSSPSLFRYCCQGPDESGKGKDVTIELTDDTQKRTVYLTITLKNAAISSYSVSGGGQTPGESITLAFSNIEMKYSPPAGTSEMKYDLNSKEAN